MPCIGDEDENAALNTQSLGDIVWLGLTDASSEGIWSWGEAVCRGGYTNWHQGQPDNADNNEDCAVMFTTNGQGNGAWYDLRCDHQYPMVRLRSLWLSVCVRVSVRVPGPESRGQGSRVSSLLYHALAWLAR